MTLCMRKFQLAFFIAKQAVKSACKDVGQKHDWLLWNGADSLLSACFQLRDRSKSHGTVHH